MKSKFVTVLDKHQWSSVDFIVLQVEETDTYLRNAGFCVGYKFIIEALTGHVGAAGGCTFIPAFGERVKKISYKISENEADVLGFYLSKVTNIYDMPDELHTENFWDILVTDSDEDREEDDEEDEDKYTNEDYYKVLYDNYNHIDSVIDSSNDLKIGFIDKETKEIAFSYSKEREKIIAEYNWLPNDVMPKEIWNEVQEVEREKKYDLI